MQEDEEIGIPWYETIYSNDETQNGGGVIMAVKDAMKTMATKLKRETEVRQILWVIIK